MVALLLSIAFVIPGTVWAGAPASQNINPCPLPNAARTVPTSNGTLFICYYGGKPKTGPDGWTHVAGVSFYRLVRGSKGKPEPLFEADEDEHSIDYRLDKDGFQVTTYLDTYPNFKAKKFYLERFDLHSVPAKRHFTLIYKPMPVSRKQATEAEAFLKIDASTYEKRYQTTEGSAPIYKRLFLIRDYGFVDPTSAATALKRMETYWWCDGSVGEELGAFEDNVAIAKEILGPPQSSKARALVKAYTKETVPIRDRGSSFKAISVRTLVEGHNAARYSIRNLFDQNKRTAWVTKFERGDADNGATTFEIDFDKPVYVQSITFRNGYQKSPRLFHANQRIKSLEIENVITKNPTYPIEADVTLKDTMAPQRITWQQEWTQEVNLFKTRRLLFVVSGVYPGSRYTDLCLSGLTIHYAKGIAYKPSLPWKTLQMLIKRNKTKSFHGGWDWAGFDNAKKYPDAFLDFLYYVLTGNKEAYALFHSYNPEGAGDSESMNLWRDAVRDSLSS